MKYDDFVQCLTSINQEYSDFFIYWTTIKGMPAKLEKLN